MNEECEHDWETDDVYYMGSPESRRVTYCLICDEERDADWWDE